MISLSDENTILAFNLDDSVSDVFEISSNGTIKTKKSLDRESVPFFAFQVRSKSTLMIMS